MKQGFIKLSRKFFETSLWKEPRTYSRSEAWLDMIQMAGFEDSTQILNNREIEVRRGEIVASRRFLEKRWQWGSTKVTNFLDYLRSNRMINQRQTNGQTIITLCNYDIYNDAQTSPQTENKPPTNHRQTTGKPPTNQNKEYKERKEGKEHKETPTVVGEKKSAATAASQTRKKEFYDSLVPFVGQYGKETVREFFDYWSEMNKSQTKMRFEQEKTWELPKRLSYWARNEKAFRKQQKPNFANYDNKQEYSEF